MNLQFFLSLPETNMFAPENTPIAPKGKSFVFQPFIFRGKFAVDFSVPGIWISA